MAFGNGKNNKRGRRGRKLQYGGMGGRTRGRGRSAGNRKITPSRLSDPCPPGGNWIQCPNSTSCWYCAGFDNPTEMCSPPKCWVHDCGGPGQVLC